MKKFCDYQVNTKENFNGWDCLAHMHETRVFACPYKSYEDAREMKYIELPNGEIEVIKFRCEDIIKV